MAMSYRRHGLELNTEKKEYIANMEIKLNTLNDKSMDLMKKSFMGKSSMASIAK